MNTQPPVWILSAPFSGGCWLAAVLDTHPGLIAVPQLDLWMASDVGGLLDIFDVGQGTHGHGLLRTLAVLQHGSQNEAAVGAARRWLEDRRNFTVDQLLEQLMAQAAPRRLVIPDAESPLRPLDLARLHHAQPDMRMVHLTRHPWEQGCLLSAWARQRIYVPADFKDHAQEPPQIEPQFPWIRANRNLQALAGRLAPDQVLILQSESVENRADDTLRSIYRWLDAADNTDPGEKHFPDDWCFADPGPANATGGLEADVVEPFSPEVIAQASQTTLEAPLPWREDGRSFDPSVVDLASELGYGNGSAITGSQADP